jgi:dTDP-4-dehydrorhamnose 3,5-epimerase|tara:strand:+ start:57 stop:515 length:459 start_codon:yes stop_codon:yes gene_type:complete
MKITIMDKEQFIIPLENHPTKNTADQKINGSLTVIWRNWDSKISKDPEMVYVSSVNTGEIKGPHLHTQRNSYFTCISGKVVFIIKNDDEYIEIETGENDPQMIFVPKNIPSAHINLSNGISSIITLADIAWKPDDDEMKNISFDDYDWSKWK